MHQYAAVRLAIVLAKLYLGTFLHKHVSLSSCLLILTRILFPEAGLCPWGGDTVYPWLPHSW